MYNDYYGVCLPDKYTYQSAISITQSISLSVTLCNEAYTEAVSSELKT
jgi:hypothetical protein